MENKRRDFIKKTVLGTAALSFGGVLQGFSARSYGNIMGANGRINVGVMGVNSRGLALATNVAGQKNCHVISISDVDSRAA
ncbi:MAG: gfo/Idh/MocA family oxidoreductase, partial [Mangrovibacterium sp.]